MAAEILSCEAREIVDMFFERDEEEEKKAAEEAAKAEAPSGGPNV